MSIADLDDNAREEVLRREILPFLFPDPPGGDSPAFVLVAGQPGAGRSRAAATLARDHRDMAVLNGDELRAFHPTFTGGGGTSGAAGAISQAVAGWVSGAIRYAREHGHSLAVEGTFANESAAAGTARRFADAGFQTRLVVVGVRRAASLLSVTSRYLRDVQAGAPAGFTSRDAHDDGLAATRRLTASAENSGWIDRLTILDRAGRDVFDATRSDREAAFAGASAALLNAQSARMGRLEATQWLSELHHATQFAATARGLPGGVGEMLVDLHETSLREVIPQLYVPAEGKFATAMEQKTVARLVALRQTLSAPQPPIDVAAPVVTPTGPERGGMSR